MSIVFDQDLAEQVLYFLCTDCHETIIDEFDVDDPESHFYEFSGPLKFALFDIKCCECSDEINTGDYLITAHARQTPKNLTRMYETWHQEGYCYLPSQLAGIRIDI